MGEEGEDESCDEGGEDRDGEGTSDEVVYK